MKKYLKEILKTTAKVALIAAGTYFFAAPFIADAVGVILNLYSAATVTEIAVNCVGAYVAAKTLAKDVVSMHSRVEKQKREENVDGQLAEIKKELKKNKKAKARPQKQPKVVTYTTQKSNPGNKISKKKTGIGKLPVGMYKRQKQNYRDAA